MLDFKKTLGCLGIIVGGFALTFIVLITVLCALFIEIFPVGRAEMWEWMYGELGATEVVVGGLGEFPPQEYSGPDWCPSGRPVDGPVSAYFLDPHYEARFGFPHHGVDFAVPEGTPVRATISGLVVWAGPHGGYGHVAAIRNGDFLVITAHYSELHIKEGEIVEREQILGLSGDSGFSNAAHVYYEIRCQGSPIDPLGPMPR